MVLNTMALVAASKQSARPDVRSRTNVHYLVFHLTLADTITSYITMPMETFWRLFIGVRCIFLPHLVKPGLAVVRGQHVVQGADDDQDRWLHLVLLTPGSSEH